MKMDWPLDFDWQGRRLFYNTNPHNNAAERVVEIPLAFDWLCRNSSPGRILEVGNVLRNYENGSSDFHLGLRRRTIIDKFESARGVENVDILDLPNAECFETIISISTIEHIGQGLDWNGGYGEASRRDRFAPLKALAHLYDLLAPGGKAFVTVPWGKVTDFGWLIQFGPSYLELLHTHLGVPSDAMECSTIEKTSMAPEGDRSLQIWKQCDPDSVSNVEFNSPWQYANAVACLTLRKHGSRTKEIALSDTDPERFAPPVLIGGVLQHDFRINAEVRPDHKLVTRDSGVVFYGPYRKLSPGTYCLEFAINSSLDLVLDACIHSGATVLFTLTLPPAGRGETVFKLHAESELEIRLHNHSGPGIVEVVKLTVRWLSQPEC